MRGVAVMNSFITVTPRSLFLDRLLGALVRCR
jgi:hypothetical protein